MKLTDDQKDLLNGKYGEGAAIAMKIQIAIGESFEAERMVPITRAHVALSVELLLQLIQDSVCRILKKKGLCLKKIIK